MGEGLACVNMETPSTQMRLDNYWKTHNFLWQMLYIFHKIVHLLY